MNKLNAAVGVFLFMGLIASLWLEKTPLKSSDPWFQQAVLENENPVVVKFGAPGCGPCRMMESALESVRHRFPYVVFISINIDEKPELFHQFGSGCSIPQAIIYKDGAVVSRQRGFCNQEGFFNWLSNNL